MPETTDDDEPGIRLAFQGANMDDESLRNFLEAAKAAGVNVSAINVTRTADGRNLIDLDPAAPKGPARDQ